MAQRSAADPDPRSFLPLTPLAFHVLMALADAGRHGYAIIQEVELCTDGVIRLRSGTLYTLLQRLLVERLIVESDERPRSEDDDQRRRYYALTPLGRNVLAADARRLEIAVAEARRKRILKGASRA
ncbi:PadR family transcriptional regulator [soil metagenome]